MFFGINLPGPFSAGFRVDGRNLVTLGRGLRQAADERAALNARQHAERYQLWLWETGQLPPGTPRPVSAEVQFYAEQMQARRREQWQRQAAQAAYRHQQERHQEWLATPAGRDWLAARRQADHAVSVKAGLVLAVFAALPMLAGFAVLLAL